MYTITLQRMRELALIGARAELDRIYRTFPELRPPDGPPPETNRAERRKRRRLTLAERRSISQRMRAYWDRKRHKGRKAAA